MKTFLLIIIIVSSLICEAQNKKAEKLYNEGLTAFNAKQYIKADSLFMLSAKLDSTRDVFYNLGIVKWNLGDTCSSCMYLRKSSRMGDKKAQEKNSRYCFKEDSIVYNDAIYYSIVRSERCSDTYSYDFFKYGSDGKKDTVVIIQEMYSMSKKDLHNPLLPIDKYIDGLVAPAEIQPVFPGGEEGLMTYLANNIKYPQYAREANVQGTVFVAFIIRPDGYVSHVKILRGIGGGCDEEAVRVVRKMPVWKPAYNSGKPTFIQFNLPIRFVLQG